MAYPEQQQSPEHQAYRARLTELARRGFAEKLVRSANQKKASDVELSPREWARSFSGRPCEFIGEVMGRSWYGPDWTAWRTLVKALFGEQLTDEEAGLYERCTGTKPSGRLSREAWFVVGRRGGKSRILAMIAVYLAVCCDWSSYRVAGERGYITVLAAQLRQATVIMGYVKAALLRHPKLSELVIKPLAESVELEDDIVVEIIPASISAGRSRTIIAALCVAAGTIVETEDGPQRVEDIREGCFVWTRGGLRRVTAAGMTSPSAIVLDVVLSNGQHLLATPDHPVFVRHKGFVAVCSLLPGDEVLEWSQIPAQTVAPRLIPGVVGASPAHLSFERRRTGLSFLPLTVSRSSSGTINDGTSRRMDTTEIVWDSYSTAKSTWPITALFLQDTRWWSTIETTFAETLTQIIFRACRLVHTWLSTALAAGRLGVQVMRDTRRACVPCGAIEGPLGITVPLVASHSSRSACAQSTVVLGVRRVVERVPVYNLKVDEEPEYFANGILVHNCDEIAFWKAEETGANPDEEILNALRPAMLTIPSSMLLAASSRYARRGALWNAYRDWYGKQGGPLVWSADTVTMHPSVDMDFIASEYERDPVAAASEYGLEFRSDVASFVSRDVLDAAVSRGVREIPPLTGIRYYAFVDPSGGSVDSFTLAIAHREGVSAVLDVIREMRPPFSPASVVQEMCATLKAYKVRRVRGDHYAGEWPREQFSGMGVTYEVSEDTKSEIYQEWLPLLNSSRIRLLDEPRLIAQAAVLERRVSRGGRDTIDHPSGGHDDVVNAAAGALVLALDGVSAAPFILNQQQRQQVARVSTHNRGVAPARNRFARVS